MRLLCWFSAFWIPCCSRLRHGHWRPRRLGAVDSRLAAFEFADLAVGELAGLHALLDALLLIDVALHVGLHALRGRRVGIAFAALLSSRLMSRLSWFCARCMRAFSRAELPVLHGVRLHAVDPRLPALELRAFAGIERSLFSPCSMRCCWLRSRLHFRAGRLRVAAIENRQPTAQPLRFPLPHIRLLDVVSRLQ